MKKLLLLFCIFVFCVNANAQSNFWKKNQQFVVKFAPLKTVDFDQCISLSAEYKTFKNTSYNIQLDYFFNNYLLLMESNSSDGYNNFGGIRITPEYRWYKKNDSRMYYGVQTSLKYLGFNYSDWLNVQSGNGQSYFQFYTVNTNKIIWANHLLIGVQSNMEEMPVGLDYNIGFGFRYRDINTNLPQNVMSAQEEILPSELFKLLPSVVMNLKISFAARNSK